MIWKIYVNMITEFIHKNFTPNNIELQCEPNLWFNQKVPKIFYPYNNT